MNRDQQLTQSLLSDTNSNKQKTEELDSSLNQISGGQNLIQKFFFTWLHPLLSYGSSSPISLKQIPRLPERFKTSTEFDRFHNMWQNTERSDKQGWTLIKVLFKTYLNQCLILLGVILIVDVGFLANPILTSRNIDFLSNHRDNVGYGVFLYILTIVYFFLFRLFFSQYFYRFMRFGVKLSTTVTMAIYHKSLKYSPLADKQFSQAEIINYSQVDAQRLVNVGDHIAQFLYGPVELIVGLVLMYFLVGLSFLAAIGIILFCMIISYFLSKIMVRLNEQLLKAKDERMKVTQQMLDIIRFVKISAIEKFFYRKLEDKRENQINKIKSKGNIFVIMCGLFWFTCPFIISGVFLTYILAGNQISAQVAFTTMTIINMIQYSLYSLPTAISQLLQITTSLKRIEKFLLVGQLKKDHITETVQNSLNAIVITDGNFYWKREKKEKAQQNKIQQKQIKEEKKDLKKRQHRDSTASEISIEDSDGEEENKKFKEKDSQGKPMYIHALKDINTKIKKEYFTMILGDIGSGKSSLLSAIINQMIVADKSKIQLSGKISYSPQKGWIMSKTLKENIVFMSEIDEKKLSQVIHYALLEEDLKMLPKGIDTEIGEKGINLSGGQKARVSLARSLYSDRDILLLDDILSAVDVHVGEFIVKQTIGDFLKGKTVVMPTHAIKFASFSDEIIIMKKGRIVRKGAYKDICNTQEFQQISVKEQQKQKTEQQMEEDQKNQQAKIEAEMTAIKEVMKHHSKSSNQAMQSQIENQEIIEELILPEDHTKGDIGLKVLKDFIQLSGGYGKFVAIVILMVTGYTTTKTAAAIFIEHWCQNPSESQTKLYLFIGLSALSIIFLSMQALSVVLSGIRQSKSVHKKMIKGLLYASLGNFYNRVPTGRIVNRLTKDLRQLDEAIMFSLIFFLIGTFDIIGIFVICVYTTTPFILIPIIIVGFLANKVRKYYLKTQRQVCRFQKSTNSPVVSGFLSTIQGLSTIRAYNKQIECIEDQYAIFDENKKVRLTKISLQNWLANILGYLCLAINIPCVGFCMFTSGIDAATLGLLMYFIVNLTGQVVWLSLNEADFETKLVSMERLYKFMTIEPETRYMQYCQNWQSKQESPEQVVKAGAIEFKNLKARYRKDLPDVLKGIDCSIKPGEKVGIVGRTGAGKTTIINTLLGITQISSGNILIDSSPIMDISLKSLRYSITMIDQEPTLIKSTFRENLDITNRYSDQELENILKECNLFDVIKEKGGLDAAVSNTSLSAGEKQLLCICRAFLKHSKIVLIDEATANIDVKNDMMIQKVIAEKFKESTVLTIAHRLSTLKNSNKIMVMDKGHLVEFGDPIELQNKAGGVYFEMIKKHQKQMLS